MHDFGAAGVGLHGGFGIRLPNALIATTALDHGLRLVTRNVMYFDAVRGLRIRPL